MYMQFNLFYGTIFFSLTPYLQIYSYFRGIYYAKYYGKGGGEKNGQPGKKNEIRS